MTVSPARRRRRPVRVRTRLVLVLAVPTLVLAGGMAVEGASSLRARADAAGTAGHATLVLAVQDLVHALQRERALLAALLAGEAGVRADLAPAREATDRARAALSRLLGSLPPASYGPVREAVARLPALDRARTATPVLAMDPDIPATPGGPPPRARQSALAPTAPLTGPFGAPVSPGAALTSGAPAAPAPHSASPGRPLPLPTIPQRTGPAGLTTTPPALPTPAASRTHATLPITTFPVTAAHDALTPSTPPIVPQRAAHPAAIPGPAPEGVSAHHRTRAAGTGTPEQTPGDTTGASEAASGHQRTAGELGGISGHQRTTAMGTGTPEEMSGNTANAPEGTSGHQGAADGTAGMSTPEQTPGITADAPEGTSGHQGTPDGTAGAGAVGGMAEEVVVVDRGPGVRREVLGAFTDVVDGLADGVFAVEAGRGDRALLRRLRALEAISRAKEAAARERAVVTTAFATGAFTRSEYITFLEARASLADALAAFRRVATPEGVAALTRAQRGIPAARTARLERRALAASPGTPLTARTRTWLTASSAYLDALHAVQRSAGQDLHARAVEAGRQHTRKLTWLAGLGAAFLLGMVALGAFLVRSVTRPLRGLTGEATALAGHIAVLEAAQPHPRVPDEDSPSDHRWRAYDGKLPYGDGRPAESDLDAYGCGPDSPDERPGRSCGVGEDVPEEVPVQGDLSGYDRAVPYGGAPGEAGRGETRGEAGEEAGRGEFGRLAGALGDMHQAAVRIAAGRAAIRRDAAASLGGLGTRHRDLAHRQLAFISALQRDESDPAVLARLCELDRVTSRLRRNAESLLVLTGRRGNRRSSEPVPVDEVLRSVLAEIEDHHRVALRVAGRAQVRGPVVAEVAHLLAELVENALGYSPPDAKVDVLSRVVEGECRVTISDYGVGMTAGELARANARLRGEQSFLVAPTRCLGHHVVGRLAERLGVRVSLHESPGCGVTALVVLPEELLAARPVELLKGSR